jgi:hypothetical protein
MPYTNQGRRGHEGAPEQVMWTLNASIWYVSRRKHILRESVEQNNWNCMSDCHRPMWNRPHIAAQKLRPESKPKLTKLHMNLNCFKEPFFIYLIVRGIPTVQGQIQGGQGRGGGSSSTHSPQPLLCPLEHPIPLEQVMWTLNSLIWYVNKRKHVLQESMEQNKRSLSGWNVKTVWPAARTEVWGQRETALVLLYETSNRHQNQDLPNCTWIWICLNYIRLWGFFIYPLGVCQERRGGSCVEVWGACAPYPWVDHWMKRGGRKWRGRRERDEEEGGEK